MHHLPLAILTVLQLVAPVVPDAIWPRAQQLLLGAILVPGTRTVTAILRILGLANEAHFQNYHRVLNRVRWDALEAARAIVVALVDAFAPKGPLVIGLDDTIERRKGAKIAKKGVYRDPVRSSKSHFVKVQGLRWMCAMLVVPVRWAKRAWALPFLTVLCPSRRWYEAHHRAALTVLDKARQMVLTIRRWLPNRSLIVVADSSFAALAWLAGVRAHATVITRLRSDAALYEPPPPYQGRGRPRKKGARLPTLEQRLEDPTTRWEELTVRDWYGQGKRTVEVTTGTGVWYSSGQPVVPLRWVLVRDPEGEFRPQALLCTDETLAARAIASFFVRRWALEVTFEEARAHLGLETQRQWNDLAIERTTPVLLSLFSLVTLMAHRLVADRAMPVRHAAWYPKTSPTFSDALALVRTALWRSRRLEASSPKRDTQKLPTPVFQAMADALAYAA